MEKDTLGDILKDFELAEAGRTCMKGLPIIARLDGRAFHTFTKGLERPFDNRLSTAMVETAKFLVEETHASLGYTQSDEITLLWTNEYSPVRDMMFSGRFQKLTSILASIASVEFFRQVQTRIPEKAKESPVFDCRVFQVPTKELAADCFKWRELDATKNAISMAAHAYFSHKSLHGLNGRQKQQRLFDDKGINFNDYPTFFKRGTYVKRITRGVPIDDATLAKIPEKNRPAADTIIMRSFVEEVDFGEKCTRIQNYTDVVFDGAEPVLTVPR